MTATAEPDDAAPLTGEEHKPDFFGHPRGLWFLAFTEAWERFSYYGMQTLLVLYMVKYLLLPGRIERVMIFDAFRQLPLYSGLDGQPLASAIFGTYTALVYLSPILGGLLADRVLGRRRTVLLGALTMAAGHFLMAFETAFLFALLCLVLGCGMFKGNIASQVGALYKPEDLRRADAFQIFYLGINAGVIISPIIVGSLGEKVGWHYGFAAAGVGMLLAIGIYLWGQKYLRASDNDPRLAAVKNTPKARLTSRDWASVTALIVLIPVMAVALIPNNQIFNAYLIWGDRQFDLVFMGNTLPTSWLVTLDSIVSVSFLALVAIFYRWYGKRYREPDEVMKIIIGSAFSVCGALCLFAAAATQGLGQKIGLFWPVAFHFLNSIAFAHMLPVALALFAKYAPKAINATIIGLYYLAFFFGNIMVGWIGGFLEKWPTTNFWLLHAAFALGSGLCFVIFKLAVQRHLQTGEQSPLSVGGSEEPLPPTAGTIAIGAGFGIRAVARVIDIIWGLVIGVFSGLLAGVIIAILEQGGRIAPGWQERIGDAHAVEWAFGLLGTLFYHCLTEGIHGASLGKLICGLRVVSEEARPIGFIQAFKRSLAFYWDSIFFGLVGYSSMRKSPLNQRHGDHWAKSVVINAGDVPAESKRGWETFALALVIASFVEMIILAGGLLIYAI